MSNIDITKSNNIVSIKQQKNVVEINARYFPGGGTGGGSSGVEIKNEIPSGLINGVNATFTSASAFNGSTLELFKNGQKLTVIDDFNITNSTTFVLTISPLTLDKLSINYTQL